MLRDPDFTMTQNRPVVILIGGGHASGKSTMAQILKEELLSSIGDASLKIELINMANYEDCTPTKAYYSTRTAALMNNLELQYPPLKPSRFNFAELIGRIKQTKVQSNEKMVYIVYGLYALYDRDLCDLSHMKIFLIGDPDTRLIRWIRRDVLDASPKVSLEFVLTFYLQRARAEMEDFIYPTKEFADVILPPEADRNAVQLVVDGLMSFIWSPMQKDIFYDNYFRPAHNFLDINRLIEQSNKYYELA